MKTINNIIILQAEYEDLKDILALQKLAFVSEAELYNNYTIEPLTQTLQSIQSDYNDYIFLKAMDTDKIIGSVKIKVDENSCRIGKLIVLPEYQNKGIGRKLMVETEQKFHHVKRYELFTGNKSTKNIRLYQSLGYKVTEEYSDSKNPDVVLLKMEKNKTE